MRAATDAPDDARVALLAGLGTLVRARWLAARPGERSPHVHELLVEAREHFARCLQLADGDPEALAGLGRVAIADNSGVTPDKTEDGVLYVDNREPIKAYECDGHTSYTIPLLTPGGETTHTGTDFRGAMRVCQECGNKLKIPEDIRALFMAVIQGRIVLCE